MFDLQTVVADPVQSFAQKRGPSLLGKAPFESLLRGFTAFGVLMLSCGIVFADAKSQPVLQAIQPAATNLGRNVDFERDISPIFESKCIACHAGGFAENGLNLEEVKFIFKGGKRGPAVVAGKPDQSLIYTLAARGANPAMPPLPNKAEATAFTPQELGILRQWILEGASASGSSAKKEIVWFDPFVQSIYSVALTTDGTYAAAGRANKIAVYHVPTGRQIAELTDPALLTPQGKGRPAHGPGTSHRDFVHALAFNPEGTMLASGSYREAKLWARPEPLAKFSLAASVGKEAVMSISRDDAWLAIAASDNSIQLNDLKKGAAAAARKLLGHSAAVTGLIFSSDGKRLFSCSTDKSIRIWNVDDGKLAGKIEAPSALNGLAISQDGKKLISAGADKIVRVWELPGTVLEPLALAAAPVTATLSPDRKVLAIADTDGKITLIDVADRKTLHTFAGHQGAVHGLAFQASGSRLVSGGADKTVRVWDVASGKSLFVLQGPATPALSVAWQTYNQQVASGGSDGRVTLWKLDTNPPRTLTPGAAPVTISALSRDGKLLAVDGLADGKPGVIVRDVASGQITRTLTGHTAPITALAFSTDGSRLISGSADKTVLVFNLADGKTVGKFAGHAQSITAVAVLTANNLTAISAAADNSLKVWNIADAKEQAVKFATPPGAISSLLVLPNGQFVTAENQTVRVWSASFQAGNAINFGQSVSALAVSVDGTKLAIGGKDKIAKIYQLDGKLLFTLEGHTGAIRNLAFSTDGTRLVTSGSDNLARIFEVSTGLPLEALSIPAGLNAAQFAGSAAAIVLAAADKSITVQPIHAERILVSPQPKSITALLYSPKGDALFIGLEDGSLRKVATTNGQQQFAQNHGSAIRALTTNGDGSVLASAGDNKQVKLWTAANGAPFTKHILEGATATIRGISFLPDNQHIAAACDDKRVVVYSVKLGSPEQVFADHTEAVQGVFPFADGKQFISVAADKTARAWPLLAASQMTGHTGPVTSIASLPNSNQVITGSDDATVRFWDIFGGNQSRTVSHGAAVRRVAVRPDGKFFVSVGNNNSARLWNASNNQLVLDLRGDRRTQSVLTNLQSDDAELKGLLGSLKGQIPTAEKKVVELTEALKKATETKTAAEKKFTEATTKSKAATEQAAAARKAADAKKNDAALTKAADEAKKASDTLVADLKKAEDEKSKASDAHLQAEANVREASIAVAKLKAEQEVASAHQKQVEPQLAAARTAAQQREKAFLSAAFSPDNKELSLASELGSIGTFDATTGQAREAFEANPGSTLVVAYMNDGTILSVGSDQTAKAWDLLPPWKLVAVLGPKPEAPLEVQDSSFVGRVLCLAFSPDGKILATGGGDPSRSGEIVLWDVASRKILKTLTDVHSDTVFGLQFSRDGKQLLSGAADKFVKIIDWQTGKIVKAFEGHTGHVLDVSWRHDGKRIASAGADNAVKVWNVETGEQERTIQGFGKQVTALHYMGRGDNLVSSCGDKTVRFHTGSNGGNFRSFSGANDFLYSAAASADEKVVISGGQDGIIRIWNGTNGQLVQSLSPVKAEARKNTDRVARP